jgi:hypothetical protein
MQAVVNAHRARQRVEQFKKKPQPMRHCAHNFDASA